MEILFLLGLLGSAVGLATIFESDDDDVDKQEPEEPSIDIQDIETNDRLETPLIMVIGGQSPEDLSGDENSDLAENIQGRGGNDTIQTFAGDDTLVGGNGDDFLVGGSGADLFYAGSGNDTVNESYYLISGTDEPDKGNDTIFGGDGNDYLRSGAGDDYSHGGRNTDTLLGGGGGDTLIGGAGGDQILGGDGDDSIYGGTGNDTIEGEAGNNTIFGGEGKDFIDGIDNHNVSTNLIDGEEGNDTILAAHGSTVSGGLGEDEFRITENLNDTLVPRIEDFDPDEDNLQFDVTAGNGDGGGFALLDRSDGSGRDLYLGGDLVAEILSAKAFTLSDLEINVSLEAPNDGEVLAYIFGPGDSDLGVEVLGSYGDDRIIGNDGENRIDGRKGSDLLEGGAGDDTLIGDGGELFGYDHREVTTISIETDTLIGGDGDDLLISPNGNVLTGGTGADRFVISDNPDDTEADRQFPVSIITDFNPVEDMIEIARLPNTGTLGPMADAVSIAVLADGTGSEISVNGTVVARVIGGQALTVNDLIFEGLTNG